LRAGWFEGKLVVGLVASNEISWQGAKNSWQVEDRKKVIEKGKDKRQK
jgi:hypothetical protein